MNIINVCEHNIKPSYAQKNLQWTKTKNPIEMFKPYGIERSIKLKKHKRYQEKYYGETKPGPIDIYMTLPSGSWWMVIGCKAASAYDSGIKALEHLGNPNWDTFEILWNGYTRELKIRLKDTYQKAA